MDRVTRRPLSTAQAKDALRSAAKAAERAVLAPANPYRSMLLALGAGIVLGSPAGTRMRIARVLISLMLEPDHS